MFSLEGYFDSYDIARSLGIGGIRPIIASRDKQDISFFSRYCAGKMVLPSADGGGDHAVLGVLKGLSTRLGNRPVLYYSSDPELTFLRTHRDQLERYFRFLLPPDALLKNLFNKAFFSLFAMDHHLPVPFTVVLDQPGNLDTVISRITYPCIVKPAYSHDWIWKTEARKEFFGWYKEALRRLDSESELRKFCRMLPDRPHSIIIQSYIDGPDDTISSFHGYFDENSNCLGSFMGRKIRTYPHLTGGSVYIRTIINEELRQHSIRYLQQIGFQGIVKIDYKWDRIGGDFKILEINPRYNLWEVLGSYAGVNLTSIAYHHQTGGHSRVETRSAYPDNLRLLFFKMDFRSYLTGYRKTGEWSFFSYLRSVMRKSHYRVFNPVDPLPWIVSAGRFAPRIFKRIMRRVIKGW